MAALLLFLWLSIGNCITKVNDEGRAMGDIPFEITSLTTQESHILVSDVNGLVSTTQFPTRRTPTKAAQLPTVSGSVRERSIKVF